MTVTNLDEVKTELYKRFNAVASYYGDGNPDAATALGSMAQGIAAIERLQFDQQVSKPFPLVEKNKTSLS